MPYLLIYSAIRMQIGGDTNTFAVEIDESGTQGTRATKKNEIKRYGEKQDKPVTW